MNPPLPMHHAQGAPGATSPALPQPLRLIETRSPLPRQADVVVIGGGIVGVFSAYYLARRGLSVVLLEKGRIGAEQSSRNWGWCRQQNRDARELPMATQSLALWERFAADTGEDTGFARRGLFYVSNDDAELERWARWCTFAKTAGVTTHMLGSREASERGRVTGRSWKGGVYSPTDGTADPGKAAPAVAAALIKLGGSVHQHCAARGLEREAGRVSGVVTEAGTVKTRTVVHAGGAWASSFCRQLGIRFPVATVRSTVVQTTPAPQGLPDVLHSAGVTLTRRGDGSYTLAISGRGRVDPTPQLLRYAPQFLPMFVQSWRNVWPGGLDGLRCGHESLARWRLDAPTPMERMRVLEPRPDTRAAKTMVDRALALVPALAGGGIASTWAGYIDSTPDRVAAIGETRELPGFILASGFSGHGFGVGPGAGHLVADLVTGAGPIVDPVPLRPERFSKSAWGKVADF